MQNDKFWVWPEEVIATRTIQLLSETKELAALQTNNLDDPNRQKPDINKGDRNFFNLVESMVSDLKVDHFSPEEVVIM